MPAHSMRYLAAAVQMSSGADHAANLSRATALIRSAAARGARLIVLPEVFAWRGPRADEPAACETIPGPTTDVLASLARECRIHLCIGSILETAPEDARAFNTSCLLGPDGSLLGRYRKIHLFDVDLPGRVTVKESATRAPGKEPIVVPTELGVLGLSICYDLRFPELYRHLVRRGAQVLLVPSAFTFPTGAAHWEVLCRARAVENQCYLIAPDQTGRSPHGFADFGESMIVDPWGRVLARAPDGEGVITAEIDLDYLARVRSELPSLANVRLDH
jgi:deaminated glutathione amidase